MSDSDTDLSDNDLESDVEGPDLLEELNFENLPWTELSSENDHFRNSDDTFYGLHGLHPRHEINDSDGEKTFFDIMFPDDLFEDLAKFTNIRARIALAATAENIAPRSRCKNWKEVTPDEIRKFIACVFLMGVVRKSSIESYWSTEKMTETPFFFNKMCLSRDRFQLILRFLRFADYDQLNVDDPLHKVSHFLIKMKHIIQNNYMPAEKVAVDEVLLLFKGRLYFRNFIPSKRSRYGIKIYALVDQSGYMWNFHIHTMASNLVIPEALTSEASKLGFGGKVVVSLASPLFDMNYSIFCDNFFINEKLAEFLVKKRTHLCGTTRYNRLPQVIRDNFPRPGENPKYFRKDCILFSVFSEKKQSGIKKIAILDTKGIAQTVNRNIRKKGGGIVTVKRPRSLTEYNENMGMVDETDAQMHPYDCTRKSMKWTTKVGIHLLQRLLLNAFAIYKQHRSNSTFLKFTLSCIDHLFETSGVGRRRGGQGGRPKVVDDAVTATNHLPSKIPATQKKANPSLRCRVCFSKGIRKETRLFCTSCDSNPPLCAHPCFNTWHRYSS